MAKQFSKRTVLSVGTHHSPDGKVEITPQRLKHWQNQFAKLSANKQVVPMHWNHAEDAESLQPISESDLNEQKTRNAKNTIGKLLDFAIAPDGLSAELKFEAFDDKAIDALDANAVYVSPVIMPAWKDGQGNQYPDTITHLDLVNYPVDALQGPAIACALRMGLNTKPYRLATKPPKIDDDADDDGVENFADDDFVSDDEAAMPGDDAAIPGDDAAESETPNFPMESDDNPDSPPQATDRTKLAAVVSGLAQLGIVLPSDFDFANPNSLDVLLTSLNTLLRAQQDHESENAADDDQGGFPGGGESLPDAQIMDPQMQTMSLQQRHILKLAQTQHSTGLVAKLDKLLENGQCSPAEYHAMKTRAGTVRLSLNAQGQPKQTSVDAWIESRKAVPRGTFWDKSQRLRMSQVIPHPDVANDPKSEGNADDIANWALNAKPKK